MPRPPTTYAGMEPTVDSITLSWQDSGCSKWEIQFRKKGDEEWQTASTDLKMAACKKTNLAPGTAYEFRVRGLKLDGQWTEFSEPSTGICTKPEEKDQGAGEPAVPPPGRSSSRHRGGAAKAAGTSNAAMASKDAATNASPSAGSPLDELKARLRAAAECAAKHASPQSNGGNEVSDGQGKTADTDSLVKAAEKTSDLIGPAQSVANLVQGKLSKPDSEALATALAALTKSNKSSGSVVQQKLGGVITLLEKALDMKSKAGAKAVTKGKRSRKGSTDDGGDQPPKKKATKARASKSRANDEGAPVADDDGDDMGAPAVEEPPDVTLGPAYAAAFPDMSSLSRSLNLGPAGSSSRTYHSQVHVRKVGLISVGDCVVRARQPMCCRRGLAPRPARVLTPWPPFPHSRATLPSSQLLKAPDEWDAPWVVRVMNIAVPSGRISPVQAALRTQLVCQWFYRVGDTLGASAPAADAEGEPAKKKGRSRKADMSQKATATAASPLFLYAGACEVQSISSVVAKCNVTVTVEGAPAGEGWRSLDARPTKLPHARTGAPAEAPAADSPVATTDPPEVAAFTCDQEYDPAKNAFAPICPAEGPWPASEHSPSLREVWTAVLAAETEASSRGLTSDDWDRARHAWRRVVMVSRKPSTLSLRIKDLVKCIEGTLPQASVCESGYLGVARWDDQAKRHKPSVLAQILACAKKLISIIKESEA